MSDWIDRAFEEIEDALEKDEITREEYRQQVKELQAEIQESERR